MFKPQEQEKGEWIKKIEFINKGYGPSHSKMFIEDHVPESYSLALRLCRLNLTHT